MLDSSDAMTSQECRYLWEIAKLQYADIEPYDLDALQGYIAIECAESCRKGETPRYTIPRRKDEIVNECKVENLDPEDAEKRLRGWEKKKREQDALDRIPTAQPDEQTGNYNL